MEMFQATAILAYIPNVQFTLPLLGTIDATPYIAALAVFLILTAIFALIRFVVLQRLKSLSLKTTTDIDDAFIDAVQGVRPWAYSVVALFLSLQFFSLPNWLELTVRFVFLFTIVWQSIEIVLAFLRYGATRMVEKDMDGDGETDPGSKTASNMVTLLARIVLWSLGGLFVLSNLGIEVTSLIAGLGIGGIAVAFALQGILSDLFASFSIYFDKPFRIGDYVVIGENSGTVEKIGIKSTRIRTLQGEELVVSNAELTTARVQNFKKMDERRIAFTLGVTYETPYELVQSIPAIIRSTIEGVADVRFDRSHFASYGDSALLFETVYFVDSSDYATYMDRQQEINLAIMEQFSGKGIEFAYPTQTVYVKQ